MINEEIVYKILITDLTPEENKNANHYSYTGWVLKVNVIPHIGGSGKTWTSKNLVKKNLAAIESLNGYGTQFTAEIKAYKLVPLEVDI